MPPFTARQQQALAIAPKFTAVLSMAGSGFIVWKVLSSEKKRSSVKHRLLLGLSILDVVFSFATFLTTWPSPAGTKNVYGASGTTGTCSAQGFFFNYSFGCVLYNAFLSVYFVLVVKHNLREKRLVTVERCMHAAAVVWPTLVGIVALADGAFNNAQQICWIAPLPPRCQVEECVRGKHAAIIRLSCNFTALMLSLIVGTASMVILYMHVHSLESSNCVSGLQGTAQAVLDTARRRKSRMVLRQAFLYLLAMYVTWLPSAVSRWIFLFTGKAYFWLTLIRSVLNPAQGILNVLVYMRSSALSEVSTAVRRISRRSSISAGSAMTARMAEIARHVGEDKKKAKEAAGAAEGVCSAEEAGAAGDEVWLDEETLTAHQTSFKSRGASPHQKIIFAEEHYPEEEGGYSSE